MASILRQLRVAALGLMGILAFGQNGRSLPAPPGVYAFRSFGTEQGLTNLSVTALAQDKEGFLWVGTEEGLFRLEGKELKRHGREEGLPDDAIEANGLSAPADGGLWVNTGRGASFWDGRRFRPPSEMGLKGFDGHVGLAVCGGGMLFKDPTHHRFLALAGGNVREIKGFPLVPGLQAGWMSPQGDELLLALGGALWHGGPEGWTSREIGAQLGGPARSLLQDRRGRIWVRSEQRMLRFASFAGPAEDLSARAELSFVNSSNLVEDRSGRIWTNTAGSLAWFDEATGGLLGEAQGLPEGGAMVLLLDREGTLWMGGNGLHRQLGGFLWSGHTRRQGLPAHVVWSVARGPDGSIWAGTANGLAKAGAEGWNPVPGTSGRQIMALCVDGKGDLWAGGIGTPGTPASLLRFAGGRERVEMVPLPALKAGQSVISLARAPDGLWVGTSSQGVQRLTGAPGRWSLKEEPVPAWLGREVGVSALTVDAEGRPWVASAAGLAVRNGDAWTVLSSKEGLAEDDVFAVAVLPDGNGWISYRSAKDLTRVRIVDGRPQVQQTIRRPHPLLDRPILSLATGIRGDLWMGTSLGVKHWDGRRIDRYGRSSGLPGEDCAQNALWVDPNGDLWVGTSVGIARFSARRDPGPAAIPPVLILQAVDRGGTDWNGDPRPHLVAYRNRTVAFRYLPAGNPLDEDSLFQVRLIGLEDEWRDTALPEARYPNLGAGSYRFEVRMKTWTGEVGAPSSVAFEVATPWWQSWWFRLAVLAALGGGAWGILRSRTALLERRNRDLGRLVEVRTEALQQANLALQEMSMGDPLTHLRNRRYLNLTMPEEVARIQRVFQAFAAKGEDPRGRNEDLVMLMVDLDHFKGINDAHGHRAGDAVLQQVADLLREVCRESDTLVRWGGEEFLVLAKRTRREDGEVIARNLVQSMREQRFLLPGGEEIPCTCCVGFTAYPVVPAEPEAFRWEEAVEIADQCLYAAKNSGRDCWVGAFCEGERRADGMRPGVLSDLDRFVKSGDFTLRCSHRDPHRLLWK